jgi:hypothetical protein
MKTIKKTLLKGTELHPDDQSHVLRAFVHRYTGEHRPQWAANPWKANQPYPVQFKDDSEWLSNTKFAVKRDGRLDTRVKCCVSTPTWPFNPELRKPSVG